MKRHIITSNLLLFSLSVVGCNTAGGDSQVLTATGTVVAQNNMPAYCLRAASSEYGVPFENVKTKNVVARNGGFLVEGTADTSQKTDHFNCQFDSSRRFIGVSRQ